MCFPKALGMGLIGTIAHQAKQNGPLGLGLGSVLASQMKSGGPTGASLPGALLNTQNTSTNSSGVNINQPVNGLNASYKVPNTGAAKIFTDAIDEPTYKTPKIQTDSIWG